jgi:hypothetical protein
MGRLVASEDVGYPKTRREKDVLPGKIFPRRWRSHEREPEAKIGNGQRAWRRERGK